MKKILFFLLILIGHKSFAQVPSIIYTNYNENLPNTNWEFSFIQITDVHIGEGVDDFGTAGYNDSLIGNEIDLSAERFQKAVRWINQNAQSEKIKFVIISGDLTDSGENSELELFKKIADSLTIPYIPMIGNHDIWQYVSSQESTAPNCDSIFTGMFSDVFDNLSQSLPTWNNGTRLNRIELPESQNHAYFQNYSFTFGNYLFALTDFATRSHAIPGYLGVLPEADLYNFPGGSLTWLEQVINSYTNPLSENILIFAHYPMTKDPWAVVNSFSSSEYEAVLNILNPIQEHAGAWFAGHIHRDSEYGISSFTPFSPSIIKGYETDANKEFSDGHFRLVKVWDNETILNVNDLTINDNLKLYPNPCTNSIHLTENYNEAIVTIYDSFGRVLLKKPLIGEINIDTSTLNSGIYILEVNDFNKISRNHFVKN